MTKITPELLVDSLADSLAFYKTLGFVPTVRFPEDKPFFAIVQRDEAAIMLYERQQFVEEIPEFAKMKTGGTAALYIDLEKIDEYFASLPASTTIIQGLHETTYGTREFSIADNNGYVLMFAELKS